MGTQDLSGSVAVLAFVVALLDGLVGSMEAAESANWTARSAAAASTRQMWRAAAGVPGGPRVGLLPNYS